MGGYLSESGIFLKGCLIIYVFVLTGAYSKARKRLALAVLKPLLKQTATGLTAQVKPEQRWCGRRVKADDGTTILMSDTPANQILYPQHSNQKAGCGFPLAKVVVWFCVTTGAVLEVAIAAFSISEWQLSRQLYATLQTDDVVVADSAYGTYVDLALVRSNGADAVFRKHHARHCDFRVRQETGNWGSYCAVATSPGLPTIVD